MKSRAAFQCPVGASRQNTQIAQLSQLIYVLIQLVSKMAISDTFKVVFVLLVTAILCLMTYSFHYQSLWLVPSNSHTAGQSSAGSYSALYATHSNTSSLLKQKVELQKDSHAASTQLTTNVTGINSNKNVLHKREYGLNTEAIKDEQNVSSNVTTREIPRTGWRLSNMTIQTDERELSANITEPINQLHTILLPNPPELPIRGHIVVLNVYEQQTMASGNLLQLQCWAKYLQMAVVKPFMHDSNMVTPLDEERQQRMLRMEDTFDMQDWEQYARGEGYSPLIEWEEFVHTAPRKLIIIQTKYPTLIHVREIRAKGLPFPHPPSQEKLYAKDCKFKFVKNKGIAMLQSKGFVIVRTVCLNFLTGDELTMEQIQNHILGEHKHDNVSILIDEWRGLGENQRFLIQEHICPEEKKYREQTKPSAKVLRDANVYIEKYLGASPYIAVMARYEMTGLTKHSSSASDPHAIIPKCLQQTHDGLDAVKSARQPSQVFLSMDIGRYGSDSFRNKNYFGHLSDMEGFVEKIMGMNVNEWERTFELVTGKQDSGYIAMLQLVLVTKADCILFVGGGTFQRHALHLYQKLHPNEDKRCVKIVNKCTSPYRPVAK